jgi:hypothetical protein
MIVATGNAAQDLEEALVNRLRQLPLLLPNPHAIPNARNLHARTQNKVQLHKSNRNDNLLTPQVN